MPASVRVQRVGLLVGCLWLISCSSTSNGSRDAGRKGDGASADGSSASCDKTFPYAFGGICFANPSAESKRTQCAEIVEYCDTTGKAAPNLTCWSNQPQAPAGPKTVVLAGFMNVFSSGPDADNLTIEVYDAAELHAALVADQAAKKLKPKYFPTASILGTDTVNLKWTDQTKPPADAQRGPARACPADRKLRLPCIVPAATCGGTQPYCDLKGGQYCHAGQCQDRLRWETRYRIDGMPTNKPLALRVRGSNGFDDGTWGIAVIYNVYLRADAPKCKEGQTDHCLNDKGEYELEVNAISRSDYTTIPITAGLPGGVPAGRGAVAGEIRDCDAVRLENFQVNTSPTPSVLVYFNGNPVKTLPDLGRFGSGSNADGIFAALDIAPGPTQVGSVGLVGGKTQTGGTATVGVFPDSLTLIFLSGPTPR